MLDMPPTSLLFLLTSLLLVPAATTPVRAPVPTCVNGVPTPTNATGGWQIDFADVPPPANISTSTYGLDSQWSSSHKLDTMDIGLSPTQFLKDYGVFKCQKRCNGVAGCVSYFTNFARDDSTGDTFQCVLYDALIQTALYIADTDPKHQLAGGYNKLCDAPKKVGN